MKGRDRVQGRIKCEWKRILKDIRDKLGTDGREEYNECTHCSARKIEIKEGQQKEEIKG